MINRCLVLLKEFGYDLLQLLDPATNSSEILPMSQESGGPPSSQESSGSAGGGGGGDLLDGVSVDVLVEAVVGVADAEQEESGEEYELRWSQSSEEAEALRSSQSQSSQEYEVLSYSPMQAVPSLSPQPEPVPAPGKF
jgi:hypothetical protein